MFSIYIYSFIPSTGHYTQMVWAKTNKVGCGSIAWKEGAFIKQYLVCNYGPAGNTLRQPMYQTGNACSRCPAGSSCEKQSPFYGGMSKISNRIKGGPRGLCPHRIGIFEKCVTLDTSKNCRYRGLFNF